MNKKYDVIVIGSGIGGLTVASLLSKNNKVLVLEKNHNFGGYCAVFKRKGFKFEPAVQAINGLYKGNPVYEILKKSHALNNVKIVKPRHLYRSIFPDHDIVVPQCNIGAHKKQLYSIFPDEKSNITSLFDTMKSIYFEMKRFYVQGTLAKSPFILKYGRRSLKELLDGFTKNVQLQAAISQYWMYRGLPPSKLSAIAFAYIWYDYTAMGSYFLKDRTYGIIQNLINYIKSNNGSVLHDREVSKLYVDFDRVTELELDNNMRYQVENVISNIDIFKTFAMVVNGDMKEVKDFVSKLEKNSLSISAFKIYLGLNVDVKSLGIKDYEIFVNPSYDIESMHKSSLNNDFEKAPYSITIYSNLSDGFCKKGHSVISIGLLAGYDYWRGLTRLEYKRKKEEMAEIILSRCEEIIPKLREYISVKVMATPLTMERYTGNSKGSIYGWNKRSLVEDIRFMSPTTPIKNLMLSSHWTKMGGGIGGVLLAADRTYNLINNKV